MHLFIATWRLSPHRHEEVVEALKGLHALYPLLDLSTLWSQRREDGFYAGFHTAPAIAAPRVYRSSTAAQLTFFDGCPVDAGDQFAACDAATLASHWSELPDRLEGSFTVVRHGPEGLAVMVDPLGMEQLYWARDGETTVVSNSARLVARIARRTELDLDGARAFLRYGFTTLHRTLFRGVEVMPGGEVWSWTRDGSDPGRHSYFGPAHVARVRKSPLGRPSVLKLGRDLSGIARSAHRTYGALRCGISGGRDSRLVTAVLVHAGIPAQYATGGQPGSADALIGCRIARTLGLRHRYIAVEAAQITAHWSDAILRTVEQGDGLVNLWHAYRSTRALELSHPFHVNLWGIGGEFARGPYWEPGFFFRKPSRTDVYRLLMRRFGIERQSGLFFENVGTAARRDLLQFIENCSELGLVPEDMPDAFFVWQLTRRWSGSHARLGLSAFDRLGLLCSRPFIEASFRIPAMHRHTEPLHYGLIRELEPRLHALPFEKEPWRSQSPALNLFHQTLVRKLFPDRLRQFLRVHLRGVKKRPKTVNPVAALEGRLEWLRALCLDQASSALWELVDRGCFERLTAPPQSGSLSNETIEDLFKVATLFAFTATG